MKLLERVDIENQILSNLLLAGLLAEEEVPRYLIALSRYNAPELLAQLVESWKLIGQCLENKVMEARN